MHKIRRLIGCVFVEMTKCKKTFDIPSRTRYNKLSFIRVSMPIPPLL